VRAENALTRSWLDRPERARIAARLRELFDYPRESPPIARAGRYFYSRNEGTQNQPVWYARDGNAAPRVVIDPNRLSEDGTTALQEFVPSDDGRYVAYSLSRGGSDLREIYIRDLSTGADLTEKLDRVKFTSISWTPDNAGFYYNRYPAPGSVPGGDEFYFPRLMYHRIGQPQSSDTLVYERPDERDVTFSGDVSHDGRYLIVTVHRGSSVNTEVFVIDRESGGWHARPLFTGFRSTWLPKDAIDGTLYALTNEGAPMRRVVAVDLDGAVEPRTIVPESEDFIENIAIVDRRLVVHSLHAASSRITVHELDGRQAAQIDLPGVGSVHKIEGGVGDREMFFDYDTYITPRGVYRHDFRTGRLESPQLPRVFDPALYVTEQVWYPSKDGTRISMFLTRRRDLPKDGNAPVFLYGYGGFNQPMTPAFNPVHFYFVENGGIFAVANLRGGSEYGEEWHQAGMLEKKQNVFDDFAAAARWLIESGYTRKERLAVSGRSNGGLLAAAMVVQQPSLFEAAVVQVPVVDMLRYHLFTIARFWIPEYGSSEEPEHFPFLYAYSPLHNVRDGVAYPATLITTADTDDRVDPGPAKKFAARLQEAQGGPEPILIRIDTKAGHASGDVGAAGKPVAKLVEEWADIWTFVFGELGMTV
jgi:prolyl oligopeptidase